VAKNWIDADKLPRTDAEGPDNWWTVFNDPVSSTT
jgi:hypothetical protein